MGRLADVSRRTYGQYCGLAHALDVVGERWTLLIVRELASGPKRYSELADALAGIGTSLLASRMRQLESDGVVTRRLALDQPGSAVVYELSDAGRELAAAVVPLAIWGARHQMKDADVDEEAFRAEWLLSFLAADVRRDGPHDLNAVYEFHIDDSAACLRLLDGRVTVTPGPPTTPGDVTVRASASTVASIVGRKIAVHDALADGRLEVTGEPAAVAALVGVIEKRLAR
ncbi:winged helix-turn-helix transcriptional regulator [Mycolicibacterium sp. BiH015]|uniref:winged helix-turn-helix transcriptional regulator n=1 Tax=Mycolicibacterium sp. BiH015 TaxID=3018808 RepID=UPI0022E3E4A9|nr:winged helix-turn-helix transcriptional regulator [Mycolicibacterium sp. BiH015]MDA2891902.1 winged helix-turn-helix transcriptional regulator [Mycolicibacterium sp. BiH015]